MKIDVIILAAGKGTRMNSDKPKVLHQIGGEPMLQRVVNTANSLGDTSLNVVVGHGAVQVKTQVSGVSNYIHQAEQLGTGHAVAQVLPELREDALCLILYGDVPLIKKETLEELIEVTTSGSMSILTVSLEDATGYGRIVRDAEGRVIAIVEQKDASAEQLAITEINTGIMAVHQRDLAKWLPALSNDNAQGEYYLTDIVEMAVNDGVGIHTAAPSVSEEVEGINNKSQLAALERYLQKQLAQDLLEEGATLADPDRIDIRGRVSVGKDVFIDVNCVFNGQVTIGNNVNIGPNCVIDNAELGDGVVVHANSVIESAVMQKRSSLGPFGRLRPGATLAEEAKVGNFVEVKNSVLGKGSKANHLAYVGDAEVGAGCNIGAGTITCNYDGAYKHKTFMGDNVFIGSNSTLVAPLTLANNAFVGAGSTITSDIDADELAVSRGKQKNIRGWKRPTKSSN